MHTFSFMIYNNLHIRDKMIQFAQSRLSKYNNKLTAWSSLAGKTDFHSFGQGTVCLSRHPKLDCHAQNNQIVDHILSQMNSVHNPIIYFLKISLHIILPSTPMFW
jgi:hypothetical protein